jgi:tetratricopeptide (TPR) repeat protein
MRPRASGAAEDLERSSRLTQSGVLMGTPTYMSPEQFQGLKATAKSDQFAFCVALYRGLYGWHPFAAETRAELKRRVLSGNVAAPPRDVKVPAAIYTVLLRGLQVDPEQRFPSMEALLTALAAPPRRRLGVWAATAGAALFGALVAWFAWPDGPLVCDPDAPFAGWGAEERERLAAAFARTDLAYAASASEHAIARLDRQTAELQVTRAAVCSDPLADPALAARQSACLDRRARELAVVAGALTEAEAPLVERSALLVESLPSLAPCQDLEVLAGGPAPPPVAPAAAEARAWVDEARILSLRGLPHDAERRAEHALALASRLDDGPLLAEIRAAFARAWLGRGASEQGITALYDALELAEAHRYDELTAELWLTHTRLAAERGDAAAQGLVHARWANAAILRMRDPGRSVELDVLRGELMLQLGRHTDGELALQRALNAAREHPALAIRAELLLGRALIDQHRDLEAGQHLDRGLTRSAGFPNHPDAAEFHEQLARLRQREGRIDQARDHLQVALRIRAAHPHSPELLARVHLALGDLSVGAGDHAEARRHYDAALELAREHPQALGAAELARAEAARAVLP